jgi:hypothetical protein
VLYPWFPATALVLASVALVALTVHSLGIALVFGALLALGLLSSRLRRLTPGAGPRG